MVAPWAGVGPTPPAGWLFCAGQNVGRATYPALFAVLARSASVTITIASPAIVTWTGHGLGAGDPIVFRTTGALPTGLAAGTLYYVIAAGLTANAFEVSATPGGAAVNTSGSQSGVHAGWYAPFGDGDGSTTFGIPDLRGRTPFGRDTMDGSAASRLTGSAAGGLDGTNLGNVGGEQAHTLTKAEEAPLTVTVLTRSSAAAFGTAVRVARPSTTGTQDTIPMDTDGGSGTHNTVPPGIVLNYVIFAGV